MDFGKSLDIVSLPSLRFPDEILTSRLTNFSKHTLVVLGGLIAWHNAAAVTFAMPNCPATLVTGSLRATIVKHSLHSAPAALHLGACFKPMVALHEASCLQAQKSSVLLHSRSVQKICGSLMGRLFAGMVFTVGVGRERIEGVK